MAPIATDDLDDYYPAPFPEDVPTISLQTISVQSILSGDKRTAQSLFQICRNEGFFYLDLTDDPLGQRFLKESNELHNIARDVFSNVPVEDKMAYKRGDPLKEHLDCGYQNTSTDENGQPNKAEFVNISTYRLLNDRNNYDIPDWLSAHTDLYASFMRNGNAIGLGVLRVLERELHLKPGQLTDVHQLEHNSGGFVRMFRYPAPRDAKPFPTPLAPAHTDATSMTILFNWQGGLQITKPKGAGAGKVYVQDTDNDCDEWLYVKPEQGTVIVNLGDPMVVFTNGLLKSGRHRVVTPPGRQAEYHRYSVLTNLRPANDTPMRALKSDVIPSASDDDDDDAVPLTALEWSILKVKSMLERMTKSNQAT